MHVAGVAKIHGLSRFFQCIQCGNALAGAPVPAGKDDIQPVNSREDNL
jgi:hypothetical protein